MTNSALKLEDFSREDFGWLAAQFDTPRLLMLWGGTGFDYPLCEKQIAALHEGSLAEPPVRKMFKAVDAASGVNVGYVELDRINYRNHSAVLSRVLIGAAALRGKGLGREMVDLAVERGFTELGLHRIELFAFDFNKAAISCYEKCGFVREGFHTEARRAPDGEYLNIVSMALLERDWRKARGA